MTGHSADINDQASGHYQAVTDWYERDDVFNADANEGPMDSHFKRQRRRPLGVEEVLHGCLVRVNSSPVEMRERLVILHPEHQLMSLPYELHNGPGVVTISSKTGFHAHFPYLNGDLFDVLRVLLDLRWRLGLQRVTLVGWGPRGSGQALHLAALADVAPIVHKLILVNPDVSSVEAQSWGDFYRQLRRLGERLRCCSGHSADARGRDVLRLATCISQKRQAVRIADNDLKLQWVPVIDNRLVTGDLPNLDTSLPVVIVSDDANDAMMPEDDCQSQVTAVAEAMRRHLGHPVPVEPLRFFMQRTLLGLRQGGGFSEGPPYPYSRPKRRDDADWFLRAMLMRQLQQGAEPGPPASLSSPGLLLPMPTGRSDHSHRQGRQGGHSQDPEAEDFDLEDEEDEDEQDAMEQRIKQDIEHRLHQQHPAIEQSNLSSMPIRRKIVIVRPSHPPPYGESSMYGQQEYPSHHRGGMMEGDSEGAAVAVQALMAMHAMAQQLALQMQALQHHHASREGVGEKGLAAIYEHDLQVLQRQYQECQLQAQQMWQQLQQQKQLLLSQQQQKPPSMLREKPGDVRVLKYPKHSHEEARKMEEYSDEGSFIEEEKEHRSDHHHPLEHEKGHEHRYRHDEHRYLHEDEHHYHHEGEQKMGHKDEGGKGRGQEPGKDCEQAYKDCTQRQQGHDRGHRTELPPKIIVDPEQQSLVQPALAQSPLVQPGLARPAQQIVQLQPSPEQLQLQQLQQQLQQLQQAQLQQGELQQAQLQQAQSQTQQVQATPAVPQEAPPCQHLEQQLQNLQQLLEQHVQEQQHLQQEIQEHMQPVESPNQEYSHVQSYPQSQVYPQYYTLPSTSQPLPPYGNPVQAQGQPQAQILPPGGQGGYSQAEYQAPAVIPTTYSTPEVKPHVAQVIVRTYQRTNPHPSPSSLKHEKEGYSDQDGDPSEENATEPRQGFTVANPVYRPPQASSPVMRQAQLIPHQ